jgi:hypothetical protein
MTVINQGAPARRVSILIKNDIDSDFRHIRPRKRISASTLVNPDLQRCGTGC